MVSVPVSDVIEAVKAKIARLTQSPLHLQKPLSEAQLNDAIARLPYMPPFTLVSLYREIGNGGFGPYYGLMGLSGGWADDQGRDAIACYEWLREADDGEGLMPGEAPADPDIPDFFLPICHFGCGVYYCVDCRTPDATIWMFDPAKDMDQLMSTGQPLKDWLYDWAS